MTEQTFEKAKNIKNRLVDLDNVKLWCKNKSINIYIHPDGSSSSPQVKISDKMKEIILDACKEEIEDLSEEFENL